MNWVPKLSGSIFAVMLISFVVPDVQAGDGLFGRLRNRICRTQCVQTPTCQEVCVQNCYTTYCLRVKACEEFRCTDPKRYAFSIYLAKKGYCLCLKECRDPCSTRKAVTQTVVVGTDPEQCRILYDECISSFAAWRNGIGLESEPTTGCIDMYFACVGIDP